MFIQSGISVLLKSYWYNEIIITSHTFIDLPFNQTIRSRSLNKNLIHAVIVDAALKVGRETNSKAGPAAHFDPRHFLPQQQAIRSVTWQNLRSWPPLCDQYVRTTPSSCRRAGKLQFNSSLDPTKMAGTYSLNSEHDIDWRFAIGKMAHRDFNGREIFAIIVSPALNFIFITMTVLYTINFN